jgi:RimJ/RimL family protein N-acetyltransferase
MDFATAGIRLRPASPQDSASLFRWRNDIDAIAHSLSGRAVTEAEHVAWLSRSLASPDEIVLIGEAPSGDGFVAIGVCRLSTREAGGYLVGINIDAEYRGHGVGRRLLDLTINHLIGRSCGPVSLIAEVKTQNEASKRLFAGAGFLVDSEDREVIVFQKTLS